MSEFATSPRPSHSVLRLLLAYLVLTSMLPVPAARAVQVKSKVPAPAPATKSEPKASRQTRAPKDRVTPKALQANGRIVFASAGTPQGIYQMDPDGSNQTLIVGNGFSPAWSPDGQKIAFSRTVGEPEIFIINADGTGETQLTNHAGNGQSVSPTWSPDGGKIAFQLNEPTGSHITVINTDGTGETNLTINTTGIDDDPTYSPDGSKIAFQSDAAGNTDINVMNADGTNITRRTTRSNPDTEPAWSPDGLKIAYVTNPVGPDQINVMNADGTNDQVLTNPVANNNMPAWSPDNTKLIFVSDREGNRKIYVMNANGTSQTRLTNNTVNDFSPDWQTLLSCAPVTTGLAAWYPGEGDANDSSGNNNNGTAEGSLTYTAGEVNQAFSFNGTDADVKITASSTLDVGAGGGMTVDAWINPTNATTEQPLVEWNDGVNYGPHLWSSVTSSGGAQRNLYANLIDTGNGNHVIQSAGGLITSNTYQHVAVTYDKTSGVAALYVNGTQVALQNLGVFTPKTASDVYLGYRPAGLGAGARYQGALDEVDIFSRALSATEVKDIYDAKNAGKCLTTATITVSNTNDSGLGQVWQRFVLQLLTVSNTNDSGPGSLRQAILDSNASPGQQTITFNIPGAGVKTISLTSPLPDITDLVIIDGYTQPGASANTLATGNNAVLLIELNGTATSAAAGLTITAGSSTVRGLAINRFDDAGILLQTVGGNVIAGNYLGTDAAGIGGSRVGNNSGVAISSSAGNTIGGTTPAARNVLSGNGDAGVDILNSTGNVVQGNFIGTQADGTSSRGNATGVLLNGASNNQIGGTGPGMGNRIAFNAAGGTGVHVVSGAGNLISSNSIFDNPSTLGIDLGTDGVQANDAGDADTGANNLQNFPVLTQAQFFGANTNIQGTLNSAASTTYTLQFFSNQNCDPSGNGEGQTFLGSAQVTTDGSGNATFDITLSNRPASGEGVTATATDPAGNTSEFSNCRVLALAGGCGSASFAAATNFNVGSAPVAAQVGDFNGDGKQDLVASNASSNGVSILLGDGAGNFGTANDFGAFTNPQGVAVGDFNGDGKQDLATANFTSDDVAILLGDGAGNFGLANNFVAGNGAIWVAVGDFNLDGKQDLATANQNSSNVSILLGDGVGNFGAPTNFGVGTNPYVVVVSDFNNDGKQDLATANFNSSNVSVLLGTGTGGFGAATNFSTAISPQSVTVGDFNGDGNQDLATANFDSNDASVLLGNGAGRFSVATNFGAGSNPYSVAAADVDGDGDLDLVVLNTGSDNVSILLGNGTGGFAAATNFGVGSFPQTVTVGDFNSDGKPDLATANTGSDNLSVLLNDCAANAPPSITASGALSRTQGNTTNSIIATVTDDQPAGNVTVTVTSTNPSNGVTISNIVNTGGTITADVAASCSATNATFTLTATDGGNQTDTDTLTVNVSAGTPPTVGAYPANVVAATGGGQVVIPNAPPAGSGSIASVTASAPGFTGALSGNVSTGAVTISNAGPAGAYNVTVLVTHNCGATTTRNFNLTVSAPSLSGCATPTFGATTNFAAGSTPRAVVTGDFNLDGRPDMATANANSNNVSVFLGNGAGGFGAATNFNTDSVPVGLAVADMNLDGRPDLLTSNNGGGDVSVLLGNGAGGFPTFTSFGAGNSPNGIAAGDFNLDGRPDVVVANAADGNFSLLLGDGAGSLGAPANFTVGAIPVGITAGDFNLDGKPDVAVANSNDDNVSVRLGNGAGSFGAATNFSVGAAPLSVAVGDFNQDGRPDLATANVSANNVSVLLGNGAGGFVSTANFSVDTQPRSVTAGDFNQDGRPDLATANSSGTISVRLGNGAGGFGAATNFGVGDLPIAIVAGDFNLDGRPDLATANFGSDDAAVLLNTCPATPCGGAAFAATNFGVGSNPFSVASGDFNLDGKPDLAAALLIINRVAIRLGDGTGGFGATATFNVGTNPATVAVGDVNLDGKPDLVTANQNSDNLSVLLGNGAGGFGAATNFNAGAGPFSVTVGDFNLDGKPDLAAANARSGANNVSVLLGDGTGGFGAATNFAVGSGPGYIRAGDFNLDGKPDLATANISSNDVSVLLGNGAGSFGAAANFTVGTSPRFLASGDFNRDGKPDLAAANNGSDNISVLLGNGAGSFGAATNFALGSSPSSVISGDFNRDGKIDLATTNTGSTGVSVLLGDGAGSFGAPTGFAVGSGPFSIAATDFNLDGRLDLVTANSSGANVSALLNSCAFSATTVTNTNDSGAGSLRQAIIDSNNTAGVQTITFNIAGAGVKTITPASALPTITDPVIIDGYTQPGASQNTLATGNDAVLLIELNGASAGGNGLNITAGNSTVRGLVINRFAVNGILLQTNGGNTVAGNFIGANSDGTAALGNGDSGVTLLSSAGNQVGGTTPAARNIISGNGFTGNERGGILINGATATGNVIQGNLIGTGKDGISDLGNRGPGVGIISASGTIIGGAIAGAANRIAFNKGIEGAGVRISNADATGNLINSNSIHSNTGLGIDFNFDGVTANDAGDGDTGPNNHQNFPVLTSATSSGGTTNVQGTLNSTASTQFNIQFFSNPACDVSGNGEGRTFLGSTMITTDGSGNAAINATLGTATGMGEFVTATATNTTTNDTSEFSACRQVPITTLTVTNTNDTGAGSLRQAITDSNNTAGVQTIAFNIAGAGVKTITPATALPNITQPVIIDGYTQTGASANTLATGNNAVLVIELNGTTVGGGNGLNITAGNSIVRGLVVNRFGTGVRLATGNGNTVEGCFIGTNPAGALDLGNATGVGIISSSNNLIGGTVPAARNLISGNNFFGVETNGGNLTGNLIRGNYIGTNAAGTAAILNTAGVSIGGTPNITNNTVGGNTPGAGNLISGNVTGLQIGGAVVTGTVVQGNIIGLNATGTAALANASVGITAGGGTTQIGGTTADARNVISGNGGIGINITGTNNTVQGNYIGTNAAGTAAVGNTLHGIDITSTSNSIGGTAAGAGNVISGNGSRGILIQATAPGTTVQGNFIGTDKTGTVDLGNTSDGISLSAANGVIGGNVAAARNVISGNNIAGITVSSNGATIKGNFIGTQSNGLTALGNSNAGIIISGTVANTVVGGTAAGEANTIAFNTLDGVNISSTGAGNRVSGNSIHSNGTTTNHLGIDLLGADGVNANDAGDGDTGGNGLQNFPVLTSVASSGGNTTITGTFNSTAGTTFNIEFFSNPSCDTSGNGEGKTFLGSTNVTTDASGNATINETLTGVSVTVGHSVTATATSPTNNTSEFSACRVESPSTLTVSNTSDAGAGSLRQAILDANVGSGVQTIAFNIGTGAQTIAPASALPAITEAVIIDGTTQPGYAGTPLIELNGAGAGAGTSGLTISGGSSTVKALVINRFTSHGLHLQTAGGNIIEGCYIGTGAAGTTDLGNTGDGIRIESGSANNTIGGMTATPGTSPGNVISGNNTDGIEILGATSGGNTVRGNLIGLAAGGNAALGNTINGIFITAPSNMIGGATAQARNVISGNTGSANSDGVELEGDDADLNIIAGNFIGTNITGTVDLGNAINGIRLDNGPDSNTIGGLTATPGTGLGNVISGNNDNGVEISDTNSIVPSFNLIQGNLIGLRADGLAALRNENEGIFFSNAAGNTIGGATAQARNVISGHNQATTDDGIDFSGNDTDGNLIAGNYIGTDINGTTAIPNGGDGIIIGAGDTNTIGGSTATPGQAPGNLISGNGSEGIEIAGGSGNLVRGNIIGLNAAGNAALANVSGGYFLNSGTNNILGGATSDLRNIISGNGSHGVQLDEGQTGVGDNNAVQSNYIGTDITGLIDLGNAGDGINLNAADVVTVGGAAATTGAAPGNVISGNTGDGVELFTTSVTVIGNLIGLKANGTEALPNNGHGILLPCADTNTVGGTAANQRNVISANGGNGIYVTCGNTNNATGNVFRGNYIGTDITGTVDLGNTLAGVRIEGFANTNTVGGTAAGEGNLISGNTAQGILIGTSTGINANANLTTIQGNFIGTQADGTSALGNGSNGVEVNQFNPANANNTIGGTLAGEANRIAFNGANGVSVSNNVTRNRVSGNSIHSNTTLGIDLGAVGITANDAGDPDTGANTLQNFPVITSFTPGASTVVAGTLNSTASTTFNVEFFSNASCDPSGNGEGRTFLGSTSVTTDGSGNASFNPTLASATSAGEIITATATDPNGNTSEFSQCVTVPGGGGPTLGNYANASVGLSGNATITPDAAPTGATRLTVATSTNFKGKLEADPATGVVRVTDAHPAGTYTVTLTAFDGTGATTTKTFTLTVTTPATCNPVTFAAATNFNTGANSNSVAVGDFNGDGRQDLAAANNGANNVSVLLGDGAGSFSAPTNFGVGGNPFSVAVGDFNGDGRQDLAVSNLGTNNVSVLLGDRAGSFGAATNFAAGSSTRMVAVGDFNGDGKQDLVTANQGSDDVSVLLGDGAGSFSAPTNFGVGDEPYSVVVGDFNGDGKQDLAAANTFTADVSVLLGDGAGSFGAANNFAVGILPFTVALGDFNGDNQQDLATANQGSNNVSVILGDGAGNFGAPANVVVLDRPSAIAVGDFNGDGTQDLVTANRDSDNVSLLLNDGLGNFSAPTYLGVGAQPLSVAVGDFNGDGKQDLATANASSNNVSVLLRNCPPQTFTVTNTNDTGAGSLRQAILDANANRGQTDTIAFNIAGAGPHTIAPASALPDITDPVVIDGYTQPGASQNTLVTSDNAVILIELNGAGAGAGVNGLSFVAGGSGSTVRGLVINRFTRDGISLNAGDNITITGNFIGTDPTGLVDLGNAGIGVEGEFFTGNDNNTIGGATPAARNIISGNGGSGIEFGAVASNNTVQGNFIGLGANGTASLGNTGTGVGFGAFTSANVIGGDDLADGTTDGVVNARNYISGNGGSGLFLGGAGFGGATVQGNFIGTDVTGTRARANTNGIDTNIANNTVVGGATAGAGNLISGNTGQGIAVQNTGGFIIKGNRIGTQADGVSALGNGGNGVFFNAGPNNTQIGGAVAGEGNVIAFNGGDGVQIDAGTGNSILSNSIHSNGTTASHLGIDLGTDGVTANDAGDADTGSNNLQNFPILTAATSGAGNTTISGTLNSTASTTFRVEFFSNPTCDASGNGEGRTFLGSTTVNTDASGNAAISATLASATAVGESVTATATDPANNTSEFSACRTVTAGGAATDVSWINAAGGDWNVAANWQDGTGVNRVPTTNDNAFITLNGTYAVNLNVNATVASLTLGGASGAQTFTVINNTLTLNGASVVNANGVLNLSGGTINGAGPLTVGGALNWSGGGLNVSTSNVTAAGVLNLTGAAAKGLFGSLNNSGTATWTGTGNFNFDSGTLANLAGATFDIQTDASLADTDGTGSQAFFTNAGTLRKSAGAGTTTFNAIRFTNTGGVEIQTGTMSVNGVGGTPFNNNGNVSVSSGAALTLNSDGTSTGDFALSGALNFTGGNQLLDDGVDITGAGFVNVPTGGQLNAGNAGADVIDISNLALSGGVVGGTGTLNVGQALNWTAGSMFNPGTTNIAAAATVNIGGAANKALSDNRTLNNSGAINWTGTGAFIFDSAAFNNLAGATFDIQTDASLADTDGTGSQANLSNAGTIRKSAGAGTTTFNAIRFTNTGTVEVQTGTLGFTGFAGTESYTQTAGTTLLNGGNLSTAGAIAIQGGELRGVGTVTGNVNNTGGTVRPGTSPGCLNLNGNYTQGAGGALDIEVGGATVCTQFDRLSVTGTATLDGTLNAALVSGFNPAPAQSFQVLTFASRMGTFTNTTGPFTVNHNATGVTVVSTVSNTLTVMTTADGGAGSLRQAMIDSNNTAGTQTIAFNIAACPGAGVCTISPTSALPTITDPVIIDGTTQPGYAGTPLIELNGASAGGGVSGLTLQTSDSTVRALVINRFGADGININGSNNRVEGCYVGTDATGTIDLGNADDGIQVYNSTDSFIGGTTVGAGNLISGNDQKGIEYLSNTRLTVQGNFIGTNAAGTAAIPNEEGIRGGGFGLFGLNSAQIGGAVAGARNVISGNTTSAVHIQNLGSTAVIQGNYIGTNAAGTAAIPNGGNGIIINTTNDFLIGGTTAAARNVISGNGERGILIFDNAQFNTVQGNYIGTQIDGVSPLGNAGAGIEINFSNSGSNNTIGGTMAGAGNTIAFNAGDGVLSAVAGHNRILGNSIFSNGGLGIDLNPDGVTPNDAGDADTGANDLQNFPILTSVSSSGGNTAIAGTLNSTANTAYRIEFFSNAACDASGNGEGRTFLGSTNVTTDASGDATISTTLASATAAGEFVTATATDPANNTSEFSACRLVAVPPSAFTLSGQITAGASGLSGVTVTLSGSQTGTTTTDAGGNYSFASLAAGGNYTVTPSLTNFTFAPPSQTFNNLSSNQTANFTATLNTFTISGQVTEGASGLSGVTVTLSGSQAATATTDAAGNYAFANLPAGGNYTVTPSRTNYTFAPPSQTFNNLSANGTANFTATLNTFTINGQIVVGAAGLSGVTVTLSGSQSAATTTDANGNYTFAGLAAGGNYTVTPSLVNYTFAPPSQTFNNLSSNQTANFTATLNTFTIGGRIADGSNNSLAGVTVTLSGAQSATTTTDANGNYSFANLGAGGNYTVTPTFVNYTFAPSSQTSNNLTANGTANFIGTLNMHGIGGRIADAGNNSLAGVTITLSGSQAATTTTDAGGNYSFNLPAGGNYTVTPSLANFTFTPPSQTFNNLSGNQTANFTATLNTFTIGGQIVAGASGLSGVTVTLSGSQTATTTTDASGNYAFANVPAGGNYVVTPSRTNYSFSPASQTFNNLSANQTANFTATLNTHTIGGRITDGGNQAIAGVTVTLSGGQSATTTTDAGGNYSFTNLAAGGAYTVTPTRNSFTFTPPSQTFNNLSANQTADFTAAFNSYTISGRVRDTLDGNLSGVTVTLGGAESRTVMTGADGLYSFTTLAQGAYTVTPVLSGYAFTPPAQSYANLTQNEVLDFTGTPSVPTPAGQNVTVVVGGFSITFTVVNTAGITNAPPLNPAAAGALPAGYTLFAGSRAADITTTANFSGVITVCTNAPTINDPQAFAGVRLLHSENGVLVDRTSSTDFNTRTVCGQVTSLSPFVLAMFTTTQPQEVSGRVINAGGTGLVNVLLTVTDADTGAPITSTTTNPTGNYRLLLPIGGDYTITASKVGMTFIPAARTFDDLIGSKISDYVATPGINISGRVAGSSGNGVGNVNITLSGTVTRTVKTLPNGNFLFTNLPPGGDYVVQADSGLLTFDPPQIVSPALNQSVNFVATPRPILISPQPIEENFDGSVRDPLKFTVGTLTQPPGARDPNIPVVQANGKLKISPRSGIDESSFNGYVTVRSVDFSDAQASIEVNQTAADGAETSFAVGRDERNFFRFVAQGIDSPDTPPAGKAGAGSPSSVGLRRLIFQARNAGVLNGLPSSIPYDPVQHRYWRFRHAAVINTMFFETSPDRIDWTERHRLALGGAIGALITELNAGTSGRAANPGQALFDNLSVQPSDFDNRANNVRLAQANYSVDEGAGVLTLKATRAGDTSFETTLDYATEPFDGVPCATVDGKARPRCDFATTAGTLRFAPGETEKNFTIFITDDSYVEGTETFRIALGFPSAGIVESPQTATVTITDNDTTATPNPINTSPFLVRQQYLDFLNREPDTTGFNAWVNVLQGCAFEGHFGPGKSGSDPLCDRITVSSSFFRSPEFQIKGYFVYRFYKASLGRLPTYEEFLRDTTSVTGATAAEVIAKREAFAAAWVERGDFLALNEGITSAEYVDGLAATAGIQLANRTQLVSDLEAGRRTRAQVLREVVDDPQFVAREFNPAFVLMQYFGYLQRDPDEKGYQGWLNLINTPGNFRTMIFGFLYSQEYQLRFGAP